MKLVRLVIIVAFLASVVALWLVGRERSVEVPPVTSRQSAPPFEAFTIRDGDVIIHGYNDPETSRAVERITLAPEDFLEPARQYRGRAHLYHWGTFASKPVVIPSKASCLILNWRAASVDDMFPNVEILLGTDSDGWDRIYSGILASRSLTLTRVPVEPRYRGREVQLRITSPKPADELQGRTITIASATFE